jgi:hypothetical protein
MSVSMADQPRFCVVDFQFQAAYASLSDTNASYAIPVRQVSALPAASSPRYLAIMQLPFS